MNEPSQDQHDSAHGPDVVRIGMILVTGLVGIAWMSSYFLGIERYRSVWFTSKSALSEEARWWVSNFGSFGYAWRSQAGPSGSSPPLAETNVTTNVKTFRASSSALDNVHPEGSLSWHWVHYVRTPTKMGSTITEYGHLYVPYWMPFLACGVLAAFGFRREKPLRRR